ncbi:hypothetical protein FRB96_009277 [Tulasnella sp. 330]|nr:hypothetical protein FRB96_009277 [Tulasnella sp. 330]KAG8889451.1 hypothetical protein FRB98_004347 [Tulasnella sp. 332]
MAFIQRLRNIKNNRKAKQLDALGVHHAQRFGKNKKHSEVQKAVVCLRRALALRQKGHPKRALSLLNLSRTLNKRFHTIGNSADLDERIHHLQEIVTLLPCPHIGYSSCLESLATALNNRFDLFSRQGDLEESVKYYRLALKRRTKRNSYRAITLYDLATTLHERYQQVGDQANLDEAIGYLREALDLRPEGHPDRLNTLDDLAIMLRAQFERSSDLPSFEEAFQCHRETLEASAEGSAEWAVYLSHTAAALNSRFIHYGNRSDLNDAISYYTKSLVALQEGDIDRSNCLDGLGVMLATRFDQMGDHADIDEAIKCHREALDCCQEGSPERPCTIGNLANALVARFDLHRNLDDLKESVKYHRSALGLRPMGHTDRSDSLDGLACALLHFSRETDGGDYLSEVIELCQESLRLRSVDNPYRPFSLHSLGSALHSRFLETKDPEKLEEAITYFRQSLEFLPKGAPDRPAGLIALSSALLARLQRVQRDCQRELEGDNKSARVKDEGEIISLLIEICTQGATVLPIRLNASFSWVYVAREFGHPSALDAYRTAIQLMDTSITVARVLERQHEHLTREVALGPESVSFANIVYDAASLAIEENQPRDAVELLEQGRSLLFNQLGRYRTSLDDLQDTNRELADQFEDLSAKLESSVVSGNKMSMSRDRSFDESGRYHEIWTEWRAVVDQIRAIPSFATFQGTTPFNLISRAAESGPVVIVNVSNYRSDAIIVLGNADTPIVVPLPEATPAYIQTLSDDLRDAMSSQPQQPAEEVTKQANIVAVLRKLWKAVVRPVTVRLKRDLHLPDRSRVWWCPTAMTWLLPLHAAGPYDGKQNFQDIFICSYTPTLGALNRSRQGLPVMDLSRESKRMALFIGNANAPGEAILTHLGDELAGIMKRIPDITILKGEKCTREAVLAGLDDHAWVHFACHGHQDLFRSDFALADGPLYLIEIIKKRLPLAELAMLSACHSAAGDHETPDEAIHLAGGMQFAGFRSVIGTMWSIWDVDGPLVAREFYQQMVDVDGNFKDCSNTAKALSAAVRALRKEVKIHGGGLERWIPFVHFGA